MLKIKLNNDMVVVLDNQSGESSLIASLVDTDGEILSAHEVDEQDLLEFLSKSFDFDKVSPAYKKAIIRAQNNADISKTITSLEAGQKYLELDTEKTIVLDRKLRSDIWGFKVYDATGNYLYDTSSPEIQLAKDIVAGYVVSKADIVSKKGLEEQIKCAQAKCSHFDANSEESVNATKKERC